MAQAALSQTELADSMNAELSTAPPSSLAGWASLSETPDLQAAPAPGLVRTTTTDLAPLSEEEPVSQSVCSPRWRQMRGGMDDSPLLVPHPPAWPPGPERFRIDDPIGAPPRQPQPQPPQGPGGSGATSSAALAPRPQSGAELTEDRLRGHKEAEKEERKKKREKKEAFLRKRLAEIRLEKLKETQVQQIDDAKEQEALEEMLEAEFEARANEQDALAPAEADEENLEAQRASSSPPSTLLTEDIMEELSDTPWARPTSSAAALRRMKAADAVEDQSLPVRKTAPWHRPGKKVKKKKDKKARPRPKPSAAAAAASSRPAAAPMRSEIPPARPSTAPGVGMEQSRLDRSRSPQLPKRPFRSPPRRPLRSPPMRWQ